ncbi:MAG: hypothetical protein CFE21_09440 [Bacteroidetes bacterium B1(2017)]|nr:MAG: hypothetical protein CFE21_09440 [Bacteroidetes bacterium B1(2017)]
MSAIDQYKHTHLGFIECPSSFDFVYSNATRKIAIYELLENIPNGETEFDGKEGDILIGGGSGEAPAFRISLPESLLFFTGDKVEDFDNYEDLFKAFWTPTQAYILCEGFSKVGWTPAIPIEFWLAENSCLLLIDSVERFLGFKIPSLPKSALNFIN